MGVERYVVTRGAVRELAEMLGVRRGVRSVPVLRFVRRRDAERYLEMYGIDLERSTYRCVVCGARITRDNVGMLVSDGERAIFGL